MKLSDRFFHNLNQGPEEIPVFFIVNTRAFPRQVPTRLVPVFSP